MTVNAVARGVPGAGVGRVISGGVGTTASGGGLVVSEPPPRNTRYRIAPNAISTITTMPMIRIVDDPDLLGSGGGAPALGAGEGFDFDLS